MFKRTILVVFIFGLMLSGLIAQPAVQMHISDNPIGSKDAVEVTYEFSNISQPAMPDINFSDWDVNGPSISQSTSIINGNATSSFSYIYTLYPKHIGTLKVPGITFDYKGKQLVCREQTIKVVPKEHVPKKQRANSSPFGSIMQGMPSMPGMGFPSDIFGTPANTPPPVSGVIVHPGQSYDQAATHDFFIKITPSKSTFYVGEPILVDYEFFGAVNCNWQPERFPSFNGFSVTDIERNLYPYDIKVDGRSYRARGIRKAQLVALKTGDLPLDSASVQVQTTFIDAGNPADRNNATAIIKSKPKLVTVLPLPTVGQPGNYSGAIGHFSVRASVDDNKLPAGENNRLHIHITGTGNLDGVLVPDIKWPEGIQAYDARDSQSVNKTNFPMERSLDFEVPFIGKKEGGIIIPPITFNYFNPDTKTYVTDSTDKIQLQFTAPLKDNGVTESLAQHHNTNKDYLWILVGIAVIVGGIFGFAEYKKAKRHKGGNNKKNKTSKAQQSGAKPNGQPGAAQQSSGTVEGIVPISKPGADAAGTTQTLQHVADHLQYLPEGLSNKIKAKNSPQPGVVEQKENVAADLPVRSRAELREEAIRELRQRQDPKEFFVLAKAYIIEELQYQLDSQATDEHLLMDQLGKRNPALHADLSALIKTCNKALYLPVGVDAVRASVLDRIETMVNRN